MAKLLVVDDEKNIRSGLAKFLESRGHQVTTAECGPRALAVLAGESNFDLVLTDYQMAEMNSSGAAENKFKQQYIRTRS